jgi:hypothetical protein
VTMKVTMKVIMNGQTAMSARKITAQHLLSDTPRDRALVINISIVYDGQKALLYTNTQRTAKNHTCARYSRETT